MRKALLIPLFFVALLSSSQHVSAHEENVTCVESVFDSFESAELGAFWQNIPNSGVVREGRLVQTLSEANSSNSLDSHQYYEGDFDVDFKIKSYTAQSDQPNPDSEALVQFLSRYNDKIAGVKWIRGLKDSYLQIVSRDVSSVTNFSRYDVPTDASVNLKIQRSGADFHFAASINQNELKYIGSIYNHIADPVMIKATTINHQVPQSVEVQYDDFNIGCITEVMKRNVNDLLITTSQTLPVDRDTFFGGLTVALVAIGLVQFGILFLLFKVNKLKI
jgi:hypothetical protein